MRDLEGQPRLFGKNVVARAQAQALADEVVVPVRKQQIEQIRANFLPIYSYILGMDADEFLIDMLKNVADDLCGLIDDAN